ncbi:MAG TPA: DNA topoisomerase, partial [Gemmatimonadales bacterium]
MPRTLLIVESPNKARKIQGFLGANVRVRASVGHVCDLPEKDYGVDLTTLEERYEVRNRKVVGELRKLVKEGGFERVLLGTDPDREGEAIAWHLQRELRLGRGAIRVEFREITAAAIRASLARPRPVDLARVDAQRARRVLDRVVGFDVSSEICWPAGATSAGRVQTPALHILCEREREIMAFVPEQYWTLGVEYGEGFTAVVPDFGAKEDGERDGAPEPSRLRAFRFPTQEAAESAREEARRHPHVVRSVDRRRTTRRPEAPYTTSTLQQDGSRKLRLSAKQVADQAQALFEAGYITYHRTDSVRVSDEAVEMAREHIARLHPDALPERAPRARAKAGAQDAHEAIRPTKLEGDDAPPKGTERLYALIKARFLASQSKPALFDRTLVIVDSGPVTWAAEGAVLVEPGFLHFWRPYARQEDVELPAVAPGQLLTPGEYEIAGKQTSPPPRYDTGALIRKLEQSGIGRPATFASIIETLLRRGYVEETTAADAKADVKKDGARSRGGKKVLRPTAHGLEVDGLLTSSFPELVSEGYTAEMEGELDRIERSEGETRPGYLKRWYADFRGAMTRALPRAADYRASHGLTGRAARRGGGGGSRVEGGARGEETGLRCDRCGEADYRKLARRKGRGTFLSCPACRFTRDVRARTKPGGCPKCGSTLVERKGKKKGVKFFGCARWGAAERPCDHVEWIDAKPAAATTATAKTART